MNPSIKRVPVLAAVAVVIGVIGAAAGEQQAVSKISHSDGLVLEDQTYAVAPGSSAHFELLVTADVPEIAPTTTTTTTTTTSTTTSTTTTTTIPENDTAVPPSSDPPQDSDGAPPPATTVPPTSTTTTTTTIPGPQMIVQVRAHRQLVTRDAVDRVLDDSPGPVIDILEFELDDVARYDSASSARRIELDVPITSGVADVDQLDLLGPGVYPITIQIRRDGLLVTEYTTFVEVTDTAGVGRGPFRFSILAALDDPGPQPGPTELVSARTALNEIADLAAETTAPIAMAISPGLLETLLDDEQLATRFRSALDTNDGFVSLPEQMLDPSAAADAGLGAELEARLISGEALLADLFPTQPVTRSAWPTDVDLTAPGAALLRDLDIPLLVVPWNRYLEYNGNVGTLTDTSLLLGAGLPDDSIQRMLIVDPITELLDPDHNSGHAPIEDAVRLMAHAGAMRYQLDPDLRTMLLGTSDLTAPDPIVLSHLERFVGEHPDFSFQPLDRVADITNSFFVAGVPVTVTLDDQAPVSLTERVESITESNLRIADVDSMLPAADPRPAEWDSKLRSSLSTELDESEATRHIDAVDAEVAEVRGAVHEPERFSFTITGRQADIPVRIENTSATPLKVVVRLEAEKLSFPSDTVEATLLPNAITAVPVPVTARSNGVFPVLIEVSTPAGNPLTEPVELTARVNSLAGLGRVVTVGAGLVLVSWWYSYFRRRRKQERRQQLERARSLHPAGPAADLPEPGEGELATATSPDAEEAALGSAPPTGRSTRDDLGHEHSDEASQDDTGPVGD